MDRNSNYYRQVQLLASALPYVARETCFALKGGTAINLFYLPMPRLSVDIDLTYLPIEDRGTSLANARAALQRIVDDMMQSSPGLEAHLQTENENELRALMRGNSVQIKIELSPVFRGSVYKPANMEFHKDVAEEFGFVSMPVLRKPDLYGGKICAALDRQHPRDLFDIKMLLESGGMTREIFEGFLVYLISSGRPISELLAPNFKDISAEFNTRFDGMTKEPVHISELEGARVDLVESFSNFMTDEDKQFLLSVKRGQPQWNLFPIPGIEQLPSVRWKLMNIKRMPSATHEMALAGLEEVLSGI
jgi:hypothetical protein